jgi:hypothetical protein
MTQYDQNEAIPTESNQPESDFVPPEAVEIDMGSVLGWPGYRNRFGRSGLDYIDTENEYAHMQGVCVHHLITFNIRTRNPFYLLVMVIASLILFGIPSIFILGGIGSADWGVYIALISSSLNYLFGLLIFINLILSLIRTRNIKVD